MTHYELHPLCSLFPRMAGAEFDALREDIRVNGLRQLIVLKDGMILDGGNRYRACIEAGVKPRFDEYHGENLAAFVLSQNLHRRHMTPGQQAAIVASAQDWARAQGNGGDRKSDQSATLHSDRAIDRAAESGASLRTQKMADKVAKADPALAIKVGHGEVSLPAAVAQVEAKAPKKVKKSCPPADTATVTTPPEKHDEAPAPFNAAKPGESGEVERLRADLEAACEFVSEQGANLQSLLDEVIELRKVCEADDKLAAAADVIKQKTAENRVLREQLNGAMATTVEAQRAAKSWRAKHDKLAKEIERDRSV